jgi:hypothetical protein
MPTVPRYDLPKGLSANRPVVPLVIRTGQIGGNALLAGLRLRGDGFDRLQLGVRIAGANANLSDARDTPAIRWGSGALDADLSLARRTYGGRVYLSLEDPKAQVGATLGGALLAVGLGDTPEGGWGEVAVTAISVTVPLVMMSSQTRTGGTTGPGILLSDGTTRDLRIYRQLAVPKTLFVDDAAAGPVTVRVIGALSADAVYDGRGTLMAMGLDGDEGPEGMPIPPPPPGVSIEDQLWLSQAAA